jgi:hypothetical protein
MAAANRAERRAQRKWKVEEFREQAFEAKSTFAHIELEVGGKTFVVPNPMALDDPTQARVEQFQRGEGLDRVTIYDDDGKPLKGVDGEPVTRIKEPHQIDGKVLEPVSVRSARAILGDDVHEAFIAAGGRSSDVTLAWDYMMNQVKERTESDPN